MRSVYQILPLSFVLFLQLPVCSNTAFGKTRAKHDKHAAVVGFKTGKEVLFTTRPSSTNHCNTAFFNTHTVLLKKQINSTLKLETGITYINNPNQISVPGEKFQSKQLPYRISVPVTLQYYVLPKAHKFHPYCGAGVLCTAPNHQALSQPQYATDQFNSHNPSNQQPGNKYISIIFTQGVTFEVNTKIEVTQSFHFVPYSNEPAFGIDLGIGYRLP